MIKIVVTSIIFIFLFCILNYININSKIVLLTKEAFETCSRNYPPRSSPSTVDCPDCEKCADELPPPPPCPPIPPVGYMLESENPECIDMTKTHIKVSECRKNIKAIFE